MPTKNGIQISVFEVIFLSSCALWGDLGCLSDLGTLGSLGMLASPPAGTDASGTVMVVVEVLLNQV